MNHLRDHLSLKSVRRVVMHEPLSNLRPIIFVQFANGTPKTEVWRGLQGTSAREADCGKIVVAVSEDIDPDNTDAVMWSPRLSLEPIEDVHIEPYRSTGHAPKSGAGRRGLDAADRCHPLNIRWRRWPCRGANSWSARRRCGRISDFRS